ncbi:hypothetical protein PR048_020468 [Dryococelus australis]|uniref:HAT C-terminal dimerisation domain-containing protein n=1 Tax=Dryococelus australis TaxID=614101 RepID=A0ABQ9H6F2_9NEOP|nr:hypothetical protein PR048_020468 [Dryococelus australis]
MAKIKPQVWIKCFPKQEQLLEGTSRATRGKERDQKNPLGVIQDVETRWTYEFYMPECVLQQQEYIAAELASSNTTVDSFDSQEGLLATSYLSGNKYTTRCLVMPVLNFIETSIERAIGNSVKGKGFAKNLMKSFKTRFPFYKEDPVKAAAMAVDPRFKVTLLNDSERQSVIMHIKKEERKLQSYLESPLVNRKEYVYNWYKTLGCNSYPNIARIAAKYLPIPATSVTSVSLFSSAENTEF